MNEELRKRILNNIDFLLERFTEEEILTILDALGKPSQQQSPYQWPLITATNDFIKANPLNVDVENNMFRTHPKDEPVYATSSAETYTE